MFGTLRPTTAIHVLMGLHISSIQQTSTSTVFSLSGGADETITITAMLCAVYSVTCSPCGGRLQPSHSSVTFGMLLPGCEWVQVPDTAEIRACVLQIVNPLVNHSHCACITNDH